MVTFKFDLDGDAPEEIATYMVSSTFNSMKLLSSVGFSYDIVSHLQNVAPTGGEWLYPAVGEGELHRPAEGHCG